MTNIYEIQGIRMLHISTFAQLTNRSITSTRNLIEKGNRFRNLKAFRDRSRLMIPEVELYGFPFVKAGYQSLECEVFHYRKIEGERYEKYLCPKCSFGRGCDARNKADDLICPKGDD